MLYFIIIMLFVFDALLPCLVEANASLDPFLFDPDSMPVLGLLDQI